MPCRRSSDASELFVEVKSEDDIPSPPCNATEGAGNTQKFPSVDDDTESEGWLYVRSADSDQGESQNPSEVTDAPDSPLGSEYDPTSENFLESTAAKDPEVYFKRSLVPPDTLHDLEEGDTSPIEFRIHGRIVTLEVQWMEVCSRRIIPEALKRFDHATRTMKDTDLSWIFYKTKYRYEGLTTYSIWVVTRKVGDRLHCASLNYYSAKEQLELKRPDKRFDLIADLVKCSEEGQEEAVAQSI